MDSIPTSHGPAKDVRCERENELRGVVDLARTGGTEVKVCPRAPRVEIIPIWSPMVKVSGEAQSLG